VRRGVVVRGRTKIASGACGRGYLQAIRSYICSGISSNRASLLRTLTSSASTSTTLYDRVHLQVALHPTLLLQLKIQAQFPLFIGTNFGDFTWSLHRQSRLRVPMKRSMQGFSQECYGSMEGVWQPVCN